MLQQQVKHRVWEQHFPHTERTGGSLGHRGTKALAKATLKMKVITRTKAQGHSSSSSASTRAAGEQKTADTGISKLKVSP